MGVFPDSFDGSVIRLIWLSAVAVRYWFESQFGQYQLIMKTSRWLNMLFSPCGKSDNYNFSLFVSVVTFVFIAT
jgi:hypothetical protein